MAHDQQKRITFITSKPGLSHKDYDAHWSGPHAAIAKDLPGLVWYVQNHVIRRIGPPQGRFGDVQGIAEIAFRDSEKLRGTIEGWARVDELRQDERVFLGDKATYVTRVPPDPPAIGQRRIIAVIYPSADGADAESAGSVAAAVDAISALVPCHVEEVEAAPPVQSGPEDAHPQYLLFAELSDTAPSDAVEPKGPILRHILELNRPSSVYLIAAEAKRLAIDVPG
jgi:uncharacterized protein (TIGR02118 family)